MENFGRSDGVQDANTGRRETRNEQSDRNFTDILQELRVMQTGTQIIAGFLLTLPFQQRFSELDRFNVSLYLGLVVVASTATCLMLVPVAAHRELFGRRVKMSLVTSGHQIVRIVVWLVGVLLTGTTAFIFGFVAGPVESAVVAVVFALGVFGALLLYPRRIRAKSMSGYRKRKAP